MKATKLIDGSVRVFYESNSTAYEVAWFDSEEVYMLCLPTLEADAKKHGYNKVTESIVEV